MNPIDTLMTLPVWSFVLAGLTLFVILLYLVSKLPGSDRLKERGIVNLCADTYDTFVGVIGDELTGFTAFLFGLKKDQIDTDTQNEIYFKRLTKPAMILSALLVLVSFAGSFQASQDFAVSNGIDRSVAFGIPIAVDGLIVLSIIAILAFSFVGESHRSLRVVLGAFTLVSIIFNVSHINVDGEPLTMAQIMLGTVFPLVLFIATEILALKIRRSVTRAAHIKSITTLRLEIDTLSRQRDTLAQKIDTLNDTLDQLNDTLDETSVPPRTVQKAQRQERVIELAEDHTQEDIANALSVSISTIKRDFKELGLSEKLNGVKAQNGTH